MYFEYSLLVVALGYWALETDSDIQAFDGSPPLPPTQKKKTKYHDIYFSGFCVNRDLNFFFFNFYRCTVRLAIHKVHTPTNALFIKLDKVLKFTLKSL